MVTQEGMMSESMEQDSYAKLGDSDPFPRVVELLSASIHDHVRIPYSIEKLKFGDHKDELHSLLSHLASKVGNKNVIHALLCIKWHLNSLQLPADDQCALRDTRSQVCEIIAARYVMRLSDIDAVEYCLYQLPNLAIPNSDGVPLDTSPLLSDAIQSDPPEGVPKHFDHRPDWNGSEAQRFIFLCAGLTALEIAVLAEAKHFLSRNKVQDVTNGIWLGSITFEEPGSPNAPRVPRLYNKAKDSIATRLKVPVYIKSFELLFYLGFFLLCCCVSYQKHETRISSMEILFYVWLASLAVNEISKRIDAGSLFYSVDIWNKFDQALITFGVASLFTRIIGVWLQNTRMTDLAFDFISLEGLFVLPRMFSFMSLYPYIGTLFPVLKVMLIDFAKFIAVSMMLFSGFFASFTLLCQPVLTWQETWWLLTKVFFGSSALGLDIMEIIPSPLAVPLMLFFIVCSRILMMTVILCILRDTYVKFITTAYDQSVFVYSVFVLEASTSSRHAHFYPPLDLLPLVFITPFQPFLSQERLEGLRYMLLKITHLPFMVLIWIFETVFQNSYRDSLRSRASSFKVTKPKRTGTVLRSLDLVRKHLEQAAEERSTARRSTRKKQTQREDVESGAV